MGVKTEAFQSLDRFHDHFVTFTCILTANDATLGEMVGTYSVHLCTDGMGGVSWRKNIMSEQRSSIRVSAIACHCVSPSDSIRRESYGISKLESTAVLR